jgi:hypothetical protein
VSDRDGTVLATPLPVWRQGAQSDLSHRSPNRPFRIDSAAHQPAAVSVPTRDLVHRFYQNVEQISQAAVTITPLPSTRAGLPCITTARPCPSGRAADRPRRQPSSRWGLPGLLNHFWLGACTPEDREAGGGLIQPLDERGCAWLDPGRPPASGAQRSWRRFGGDARRLPRSHTQRLAAVGASHSRRDPRATDPKRHTLPPQSQKTIGDTLSARGVTWVWYAGAWDAALQDGMQAPEAPRRIIATRANGAPYFAPHHQPFNYFARFAPGTADRERHLKDYTDRSRTSSGEPCPRSPSTSRRAP